jgi:hypothetical protein
MTAAGIFTVGRDKPGLRPPSAIVDALIRALEVYASWTA